tara:strand:- start:28 stop:417 length:390 start_codon:yes stop_codon:yes gene_type:complete
MTYIPNKPELNWCQYTLDGITYDIAPTNINGVIETPSEEEALRKATQRKEWDSKSAERKLASIKEIRLSKLIETDYLSNSDVTMPDNIKTWRQSLRDIPADHTDENAYDLLLARDPSTKELTHAIWSKP